MMGPRQGVEPCLVSYQDTVLPLALERRGALARNRTVPLCLQDIAFAPERRLAERERFERSNPCGPTGFKAAAHTDVRRSVDTRPGFEPGQTASKAAVLPLDQRVMVPPVGVEPTLRA